MSSTRRITRSSVASESRSPQKRCLISPADNIDSWSDSSSDGTLCETDMPIYDLDEACSNTFDNKDHVWIRTKEGNWHRGTVVSGPRKEKALTRHVARTGTYYPVVFGTNSNIRKYFAPLNGEIKPDTPDVRELLIDGGWLEMGEDDANSWPSSR